MRARPGRGCSATTVPEAAAELRGGSARDPAAGSLGRRRREIRPRELHHGGAKVSGKPRARLDCRSSGVGAAPEGGDELRTGG